MPKKVMYSARALFDIIQDEDIKTLGLIDPERTSLPLNLINEFKSLQSKFSQLLCDFDKLTADIGKIVKDLDEEED